MICFVSDFTFFIKIKFELLVWVIKIKKIFFRLKIEKNIKLRNLSTKIN